MRKKSNAHEWNVTNRIFWKGRRDCTDIKSYKWPAVERNSRMTCRAARKIDRAEFGASTRRDSRFNPGDRDDVYHSTGVYYRDTIERGARFPSHTHTRVYPRVCVHTRAHGYTYVYVNADNKRARLEAVRQSTATGYTSPSNKQSLKPVMTLCMSWATLVAYRTILTVRARARAYATPAPGASEISIDDGASRLTSRGLVGDRFRDAQRRTSFPEKRGGGRDPERLYTSVNL